MESITVLVPHKNSPNKLKRMLDSVPFGVYVIVVDDKSTDDVLDAVKSEIFLNSNAELIENEQAESNAGVARNIALKHDKTEWVIFADADDEFYKAEFEGLISYLNNSAADVVLFGVEAFDEKSRKQSPRADVYKKLIALWPSNKETILHSWVVPWGRAIRRSYLVTNEIVFSSRYASNDVEFSAKLAVCHPVVGVYKKNLYCCYDSPSSLTATLTPAKAKDRLAASVNRNFMFYKDNAAVRLNYNVKYFFVAIPSIIKSKDFSLLLKSVVSFFLACLFNFNLIK